MKFKSICEFLITEPPKALSLELEDMYIYGVSATVNCTATINPNTCVRL